MTTSVRLEAAGAIDAVPAADWDRLAGATFALSHAWLRSVERNPTATATYLLVRDGGRLAGALPVYAVREEQNEWYRPERLTGGRCVGRYLVAGSRRGHANDLLLDPTLDPAARAAVLGALLAGLDERIREEGADGAVFPHLSTGGAAELARARAATPLLSGADTVLRAPGSRFADYLAALSSHRARQVRREMREFDAAGYAVAEESLTGCWEEAGRLIGQLQHKYGHAGDEERWRSGVRRQAAELGDRSVVFTCRTGGALVGFTLGYTWAGQVTMRTAGFDYPALAGAFEYFNLCFYRPLLFAYRHGLRAIRLGQESYETKVWRGALLEPLWTVCLGRGAPDRVWAERWNGEAARPFRERYGTAMPAEAGWGRWGG